MRWKVTSLIAVSTSSAAYQAPRVFSLKRFGCRGLLLGVAQSGVRSGLRVLRVTRDAAISDAARAAAREVLADAPKLQRHAALRLAVHDRLDPDARAALVTA